MTMVIVRLLNIRISHHCHLRNSILAHPAAAVSCRPAFVSLPANDNDAMNDARAAFDEAVNSKQLQMRKEYADTSGALTIDYVTLEDPEKEEDILMSLVEKGYFMVKDTRDRRLKKSKTFLDYRAAQDKARKKRVS